MTRSTARGAVSERRAPGAAERPAAPAGDGRARVVLERLEPAVDGGRFPVKRVTGESVDVEVDAFADGHDRVACVLRWRHADEPAWREERMRPLGNDRWTASFAVERLGRYEYTAAAWVDRYASWLHDLERRPVGDPDVPAWFAAGAALVRDAVLAGGGAELAALASLLDGGAAEADKRRAAASPATLEQMRAYAPRPHAVECDAVRTVVVDRALARFGAWYEFFPRSFGPEGRHGRLRDLEPMLDYVARLGFDVVYLPPIHPIGQRQRKGPNNALATAPGDVGSPWAIGAAEGGHDAVHPLLGTAEDVRWLVARCAERGLELALDVAFQCSPDHPYVAAHPEWFRRRPDGTIQFAENPPKKYQDIYPFDFESEAWSPLWEELARVVEHWIAHGVRIFRVDNPHTKPFAFWEWLIARVKRRWPETVFLSEAFTRPKVMHRLAKLGFTQSYTYFTWRNSRRELTDYFTELAQGPGREYFRPNAWPNTPDILPEFLQAGGRSAFAIRAVLAATLAASWGVYGPAFELQEREPLVAGGEEYRDSEKYQLRRWDLARPDSLAGLLARLNAIRRGSPALQQDRTLAFHAVDNERILCFSKRAAGETVVVAVTLDPQHPQAGWLELPLAALGLDPDRPFQAEDLLTGSRFLWSGPKSYVAFDPAGAVAHVLRIRRHARREHDFDYFA